VLLSFASWSTISTLTVEDANKIRLSIGIKLSQIVDAMPQSTSVIVAVWAVGTWRPIVMSRVVARVGADGPRRIGRRRGWRRAGRWAGRSPRRRRRARRPARARVAHESIVGRAVARTVHHGARGARTAHQAGIRRAHDARATRVPEDQARGRRRRWRAWRKRRWHGRRVRQWGQRRRCRTRWQAGRGWWR